MAASRSTDEKHFVDEFREALIQWTSMVAPVLDHLLQENLLTQEQYDNVRHRETNQEKMRALYQFIRGWSNQDKDIVYDALKESNPGVIENLEGRQRKTTCGSRLSELRKQHMESVKGGFQRIKEHNARRGETASLQTRYTPLLLRKGYPDIEDKKSEILHKGRKCIKMVEKMSSDEYSPITLNALFDPEKDGVIPMVVVLNGPAGIGKTWTSRKIMLDWASGDFYQDKFDFVFYLSCRELNTITGEISLVRLLSRSSSLSPGDLMFILTDYGNHGRLLFVIDGFDEFRWTGWGEGAGACQDFSEETHKETLLRSLLRKHLLNPSSLLITTRSLAQEKLSTFIAGSRDIEVKGFSAEDCRRYFHNAFINETEAENAFRVVKGNRLLLTMCSVPILCWIACTVLRQEMKKGLDFIQFKTTTPIYLLYLQGLIIYHGRKQPVLPCLKKLCALANEGILDQKILFEEEDLERHGLSVSEVESVFLNENIFQVSIINQTCYSFIHLSMQEFLAAVHYVLDEGDEGERRGEASLPEICKGGSLPELCKDHPHLSLAVRFLFGLLYEKQIHKFSKSTGCKMSLRVRPAVEEWVTRDSARSALGGWIMRCGESSIDVISCLYETQDEDLIRRALPRSMRLKLDDIWENRKWNKSDKKQLYYCLKLCDCPMALSSYLVDINSNGNEVLSPLLHRCHQLCIFGVSIKKRRFDVSITDVKLGELSSSEDEDDEFDGMNGEDAGLSRLIHPQSQIQEISLQGSDFSSSCFADLSSALVTNQSLSKLELVGTNLQDSGVKHLYEGLRDPRCTLQELRLYGCHLSPMCCDDLRSALVTNRTLITLDLTGNCLEDSGVKRLCEWLRDPRCILQELSLQGSDFSSSCFADLSSALVTNQSLSKLELVGTNLQDSGVKHLCEGLRDPRCTLQELMLCWGHLSPMCCDDLRSALVTNRTLIKLDLTGNRLEDSGVKRLCEWLRDPRCILQELRLWLCGLSPLCCDDLRSTLVTNRSLTKLDLSQNNLEDSGIKSLCEALRDPNCILQELSLQQCQLSPLCGPYLRSVLITNRSLTKLDLSSNHLEDSGVKRLCEGLRDTRCTLQELRFSHCSVTPACCGDLCSVITSNPALTFLETNLSHDSSLTVTEGEDSRWEELRHLGCSVWIKRFSIDVTFNKRKQHSMIGHQSCPQQ